MRRAQRAAIVAMLAVSGLVGAPATAPARAWGGTSANTAPAALARAWGATLANTAPAAPARARGATSANTANASTANATLTRAWGKACRDTHLQPTHADLSRVSAATLCLIERERRAYRRGLLRSNRSLQRIATGQAREMVIGDYFGDNNRSGSTPIQRLEVSAYASRAKRLLAAQNIGWGTGPLATPAAMVHGWMLSPPHRHIMLTASYRDIGVGVAPAAPPRLTQGLPGATYTVEFAARR